WYDGTARLSVREGEGWAPTDAPCPNGQTQFFALGDELWMAQLDDEWLGWGRWHAGPRTSGSQARTRPDPR
ncbi:MAG: hypothetical protein ABMA64_27195, partial [Myxococcota bacterium]